MGYFWILFKLFLNSDFFDHHFLLADVEFTALWFSKTRVITKQLNENQTGNAYNSFVLGKEDVLEWKYENNYLYYYTKERTMEIAYKNNDVSTQTIINMTSLEARIIYNNETLVVYSFKDDKITTTDADFGEKKHFEANNETTYPQTVNYGKNSKGFWIKNNIAKLRIYNMSQDTYGWIVEGSVQLDSTTTFPFQIKKNKFELKSSVDFTTVNHLNGKEKEMFAIQFLNYTKARFSTHNRLNITYNPITRNYRANSFHPETGDWLNTINVNLNSNQIKITGKKNLAIKDNIIKLKVPSLDALEIAGPKGKFSVNYSHVKNAASTTCITSQKWSASLQGYAGFSWQMKPGNFNIEYDFLSRSTTLSINGTIKGDIFMGMTVPDRHIEAGFSLWNNDMIFDVACERNADYHYYNNNNNNSAPARHYDIEVRPDDKIDITHYNEDFKPIIHPIRFSVEGTYLTIF